VANFAATLLEAILNAFFFAAAAAATEHIFTEYNSYYSLLFSPAGNPQVPAKF